MGKRKRNTNTRRKRQYESRMRGVDNVLMEEAKLVDPQTVKGMTLLSVAGMEEDTRRQTTKRRERATVQQEKESMARLEEESKRQEWANKQSKIMGQMKREKEKDEEYIRSRKPNYWKKEEERQVGWWEWFFGK